MSEWFESLKSLVSERIGNPLILAYTLAWLFVNYPIVIMVFSDAEVMEKITFVPAQYADWQDYVRNLGAPFVIAIIYSLGAPWLKHLMLIYDFWQGKFTRARKLEHENAMLISTEERDELIAKYQSRIDRMREEMAKRSTYYYDLTQERDALVKEVSEVISQKATVLAELDSMKAASSSSKIRTDELEKKVASLNDQLRFRDERLQKMVDLIPVLEAFLDGKIVFKDMDFITYADLQDNVRNMLNHLREESLYR